MRIASVGTAYPPHRYSQAEISQALTARWQDRMEEPRLINRLFVNCGVDFRNLVFPLGRLRKPLRLRLAPPTTPGSSPPSNSARRQSPRAPRARRSHPCRHLRHLLRLRHRHRQPHHRRAPHQPDALPHQRQAHSHLRPRLRRRSRRHLPRLRLRPRLPQPVRAPALGRALLPHLAGQRPVHRQPHLLRPLRRRRRRRHHRRQRNRPRQKILPHLPARAAHPRHPAPPSIATPSTSWAGISATWDSRSSSPPTSPRSSTNISAVTSKPFSPTNGLTLDDISSYIFHSGGPKVLEAMETTLNLPENALEPSWRSLREVGNLSAASVPRRPRRRSRQHTRQTRHLQHPRCHGPCLLFGARPLAVVKLGRHKVHIGHRACIFPGIDDLLAAGLQLLAS